MKTITSKAKLLEKLKKHNLISNGHICYLSDFHRTKVGKVLAIKVINEGLVEPTKQVSDWFEKEWKLKRDHENRT
ncbi:hypothetical protein [Flavobacterium beibuense]|uniref:hypothetical protein n=1 Tax=Flavobacterium beibuense TaxID=657326 RepID=UPI003A94FD29